MVRRTQTVYVASDPFFSPRGKVLHGFDQFLEKLARARTPCVWLTAWTRAQLDEPRRRLGQGDPYIGENGCGVYLPEDYFHLKGAGTFRLGRYTCIPIAKPQPAAAEALEELSSELDIAVVRLRSLSQRELSQNTGLPAKDAELIRARDFDELFFFAGASEADMARFRAEAKARGLVVQRAGPFWSLSCGANLTKCVRELGALYDRAIRSHALRVGVRVAASEGSKNDVSEQGAWPTAAFDRTLSISERIEHTPEEIGAEENNRTDRSEKDRIIAEHSAEMDQQYRPATPARTNKFYLHAPDLWDDVMASITPYAEPRR
jgi:predicted mannosyl-3-phosphoglycerate phosphatase (HAD superfamily)